MGDFSFVFLPLLVASHVCTKNCTFQDFDLFLTLGWRISPSICHDLPSNSPEYQPTFREVNCCISKVNFNPKSMETKQMIDHRLSTQLFLYDSHTTLYINVLEGISDNDTHNRLNT